MRFLLGLLLLVATSQSAAEERVVFAQVGNSVTLPRSIWKTADKIHVNWYFQDEPLISRNPTSSTTKIETNPRWSGRVSLSSDFSLIISSFNESDFGIFKCKQYELVNELETTYKLYRVTISKPSPLLAGARLTVACTIEEAGFNRVRSTITWLGPDNKKYNGRLTRNENRLEVNDVSGIHGGKWTCEVKHGDRSTLNAMTEVTIVDLAPSPPDPIYTYVTVVDFSIPCSLSSNIPWSVVNAAGVTEGSWSFIPLDAPQTTHVKLCLNLSSEVFWEDTSNTQKKTEIKNHKLDMKISKVSIKDRGTYTCSLKFGLKTLSRSVKVEVLQVTSSGSKIVHEGNRVNLTCSLGHAMSPDLEMNWIPPPGSSLLNLSHPHPTVLSLHANVKDSGRWTCQLKKNGTVLTSTSVSLKIEKAPVNIWLVVAIIGGVLVFILLAAIAVIIVRRRRKVMKYTRRKKKFCRCKNPQPKGFYKT